MSFFDRNRKALIADGIDPARLPPGQYRTDRWPVLHEGPVQEIDRADWRLRVWGAVDRELRLSYDDLVALALSDATTLLGVPLPADRVLGHDVVRWTQALPRPSAAHRDAVAAVRDAVAQVPGLALAGAWVSGNGLASVVPQARSAAAELLTALTPRA